jgi:Na+-transporting methylmalonyl-CoA/oxaloacetate decarboxylase gamma subunit
MLPSEKAERWVRRVGYAALIFVVLYIVVWVVRFIGGVTGRALEQRETPPETRAPASRLC